MMCLGLQVAYSQDSVDVYFMYKSPSNPSIVYLPGEFNNWADNNSGVIYPSSQWDMTKDSVSGMWYKWLRLKVGGGPTSQVAGAYQYKFNENGCSTCWLNDPLNQHVNNSDNSNSLIYVKDPTIFHFLPNQRQPIVNTAMPEISAYIFPKVGTSVDTASISLTIDTSTFTNMGSDYNFSTHHSFSHFLPRLRTEVIRRSCMPGRWQEGRMPIQSCFTLKVDLCSCSINLHSRHGNPNGRFMEA